MTTDQSVSTPFGNPDGDQPVEMPEPSIIDTILDLDAMMSADVRRAEKSARFSTKPWLEADIEESDYKLDGLTDGTGRPLDEGEEKAVGGGGLAVRDTAVQTRKKQLEYAASFRTVRVQAMDPDDWDAFQEKHKAGIDADAASTERTEMLIQLAAACAIRPKMTIDQVKRLRTAYGHPAFSEVAMAAWNVNTQSGVNIPKSQLSSVVLRRLGPGKS